MADLMSDINYSNLLKAYRAATGKGAIQQPCSRPAKTYADGRLTFMRAWTVRADEDGYYWSFRARTIGMGLLMFDEFRRYKQRQKARDWAQAARLEDA